MSRRRGVATKSLLVHSVGSSESSEGNYLTQQSRRSALDLLDEPADAVVRVNGHE